LFAALLAERAVHRSNDGGTTWTLANNGLPAGTGGFIESITALGGVVYVGPLFNGVSSTANNGANWAYDRNGLPAQTVALTLTADNLNLYLAAGANTTGGGVVFRAQQAPLREIRSRVNEPLPRSDCLDSRCVVSFCR
jgi:hypothetical protein